MTARVVVGLSGGVDSSVAALLLQQQGYEVIGLFMKNWEEDDTAEYCSAAQDLADAQAVCQQLNIPLHTVNFAAEYWDNVFEFFLTEYRAGRTPNPDILCNREIKFKAFLTHALYLGADFIATGHYAQTKNNLLIKAKDANKDQTYFLYAINREALKYTLFPIGHLNKIEVRKIAQEHRFFNYNKKDSTGICFIGERRFRDFLQRYLPIIPGPIKNLEGMVLGEHQGVFYYTIGQREGLKIGGQRSFRGEPWYVIKKEVETNTLIVVQGHDHPALYHRHLNCSQIHWISEPPVFPLSCSVKLRYRQQENKAMIFLIDSERCHVELSESQRAITPGQSAVFYQEEICLGGGIIEEVF